MKKKKKGGGERRRGGAETQQLQFTDCQIQVADRCRLSVSLCSSFVFSFFILVFLPLTPSLLLRLRLVARHVTRDTMKATPKKGRPQ